MTAAAFKPIDTITPLVLPQLTDLAQFVLDEAARQGATACKTDISTGDTLKVQVRGGKVDTLEQTLNQGISLIVWEGQRTGTAHTSGFSAQAIGRAIKSALMIARHTSADPFASLAPVGQMATFFPELDLYHPWDISTEQVIDRALACEAGASDFSPLIVVDSSSQRLSRNLAVQANSNGFIASMQGTVYSAHCSAMARRGDDAQLQSDFAVSRLPSGLLKPRLLGRESAVKALARLGASSLPTQHAPVVLTPGVATQLLSEFLGAITGTSQYTGNSFLRGALGERIFPKWFSLDERPHLARALGSLAYDEDGLATRAKYFVREGVLESYSLGSYAARKLGLQSTGNAGGNGNLFVTKGQASLSQMLRDMQRGLLVTELMGHGGNPITGDYSMGASGFWVEGGEVQFPVRGITLAGNLREIFLRIVAVGSDGDPKFGLDCGSLLIESMAIAGL